jgi:hypothetical protein
MTHILARPRRRLALVAAGLALAVTAPSAVAQVDHSIPADFTASQVDGGTFVPDVPHRAAVRTGNQGFFAGHWAQMLYCTPYGPGTSVVGYTVILGRWHASAGDDVHLLHNTAGGTLTALTLADGDLPHRTGRSVSAGVGTPHLFPASPCIGVQTVGRRTRSGAHIWTVDLERVVVRDEIGPAVGTPAVAVPWVTGDTVPVRWHQQDNGLGRGATWAEVAGGGTTTLGDAGDGTVGASVPVGSLPDGVQTARVHRSGHGWPTATAVVTFGLDRTDPPTPGLHIATEAWTNADAVAVATDRVDDAGSGWSHNEVQIGDGPWTDRGITSSVASAGVHTVRVRAVDHAGRRSAPSRTGTVRIDREPPVIATLEVDPSPAAGPRLRIAARDGGGSGLGDCPATVAVEAPDGTTVRRISVPSGGLAPSAEVDVPMRGLVTGEYGIVLSVCDRAGNTTTRRTRTVWQPPAPAAATGSPSGPASGATIGITTVVAPSGVAGAGRLEFVGAIRVVTRRNGVAVLRGRLIAGGRAVPAGTRIAITDPRGRTVGTARVQTGGRVVIRFRAVLAGRWSLRRIGAPGGRVAVSVRLLTSKATARGAR